MNSVCLLYTNNNKGTKEQRNKGVVNKEFVYETGQYIQLDTVCNYNYNYYNLL